MCRRRLLAAPGVVESITGPGPLSSVLQPAARPGGRRSAGVSRNLSPRGRRAALPPVAAAGGLAAPAVARGVGAAVVTWWAAASALGLFLGVPETDHVVGVAAVIAVVVLTSLANPRQ